MRTVKLKAAGLLAAAIMLAGCASPESVQTPPAAAANAAAASTASTAGAVEAATAPTVPVGAGTPTSAAAAAEVGESPARGSTPRAGLLTCLYYDEREYDRYDSLSSAYETDGEMLCGIAPHHLTAGHMIAGMYKTAAETRNGIDTVVLAAPMHYKTGNKLCTSLKSWDTAYGVLENDTEFTSLMNDRLGAAYDDYMTEYDHSASSHIPFIKRYLPDAKVAVLLVSPDAGRDFPEKLASLMYEMSQMKNCLFTFSIDFSHYLVPAETELRDAETRRAVNSGNIAAIERFTDSNVDTPYCLITFIRLSKLLGSGITEADHGNTYTIKNDAGYSDTRFPEGVTSYFVFLSSK